MLKQIHQTEVTLFVLIAIIFISFPFPLGPLPDKPLATVFMAPFACLFGILVSFHSVMITAYISGFTPCVQFFYSENYVANHHLHSYKHF